MALVLVVHVLSCRYFMSCDTCVFNTYLFSLQGWSEGLIGARKGSRKLLVVPPGLAYGAEGMGPSVPPNSTLIFDVHLTKVRTF